MHTRILLLAALAVAGLLVGCNEADTKTTAAKKSAAPATARIWPPPAAANLPVAPNVLADNYLIVFDGSGSMNSTSCGTGNQARLETAKIGVRTFSRSVPEKANLGLVVFSSGKSGAHLWLELGTNNRTDFDRLVGKIVADGGTPLQSAMRFGAGVLTKQAQMQGGYGTYHLVVVTDGEANIGEDPQSFTKELVATTPINVHAIGFCVDGKHSLDMAGYTRYKSAANRQELERGLTAVLAESESFADSQFVK